MLGTLRVKSICEKNKQKKGTPKNIELLAT